MFRIECFVTDKHLPDVLRALGQRVMNLSVLPVVDAAVEKGKGKNREDKVKQTNAVSYEGFLKELRKAPAINAATAQAAAQAAGYTPTSYSRLLVRGIEEGAILRQGKGMGTTYRWAPSKLAEGHR